MPRSRQETFDVMVEAEEPSKCIRFLRFLWKFFRCVFSHVFLVSLVVLYCLIGAYAFEALEAGHEKEIKKSIKDIRGNITEQLWKITKEVDVLICENWTDKALRELKTFENKLVWTMEKEGWDGREGEDDIQWTFAGALFYSIVVITTIGYGHIAPKTKNGKVVTIFYAILGIPLMLLCLSNIGDIMASSFRFLYWKVCCYVCTKPPKKRRPRHSLSRSYSTRQPGRYGTNRSAFRRSIRMSQRSADSALGLSECMTRSSYSDTDCKYNTRRFEDMEQKRPSPYQSPGNQNLGFKSATVSRYSDLPVASPRTMRANSKMTTQSLDRRLIMNRSLNDTDRSSVLCNRYALDDLQDELRQWQASTGNRHATETVDNVEKPSFTMRSMPRRCLSVEETATNYRTTLAPPLRLPPVYLEMENMRRPQTSRIRRYRSNYPVARSYRREQQPAEVMMPTGLPIHKQIYVEDFDSDYEYYTTTDDQPIKPVPIWLCVFLVVSYIFGGAFLFSAWEQWPFLDSAYFCFITLTTIGFGDFVPAYKLDAHKGIAVCSLYLLFGIALLAMSFNLVQEEVINNVKNVAKRLGIIKESDDEEEADDYDAYDAEYNDEVDNELEGYVLDAPRCHSMARNVRGISVA
ncbi:potassium two pore domain channel subfamily K member galene isoform X2 [Ptiloglossa arizonensis]|uniref:potassium two pore domain channel subfamily K member galene isoform X2 n=1 Tax=Ptiloglossa arizonensis TaxID=3350558 RepID=UPI003F9FA66E